MENQALLKHFESYPHLEIRDIFKFLYQSAFGCEHMVSSLEKAVAYIQEEYDGETDGEIEYLDGDYCRVPLSYIARGLNYKTFGKLFYLSAKKEEDGKARLIKKIENAKKLIKEKKLPFNIDEFENALKQWEKEGYPAIHHSQRFREAYKPKYRLVSKEFIPFLQLFIEIDSLLKKGNVKIAIEGGSASGKSTLAQYLEDIYICTVLHMDDFFLQPHQRTPERFKEAGGNIDKERFLEEVLLPLSKGEEINYRPFDCSKMAIGEGRNITPQNLVIIEGAYSMHPEFSLFYDFSVFLDIDSQKQRERILKRNGEEFGQRFFSQWIPMEEKYFSFFNIKEKCSTIISIK